MPHPTHTEVQMRIRKPADAVFNAFIDPAQTVNFWFTKSSGMLRAGHNVTWEWEMYGVSAQIEVVNIVENQKIVIRWGDDRNTVTWSFRDLGDGTTYVEITESGYTETGDALLQKLKDSTGGFTTVLDGCKAWMEYGIQLGLVGDKFLSK